MKNLIGSILLSAAVITNPVNSLSFSETNIADSQSAQEAMADTAAETETNPADSPLFPSKTEDSLPEQETLTDTDAVVSENTLLLTPEEVKLARQYQLIVCKTPETGKWEAITNFSVSYAGNNSTQIFEQISPDNWQPSQKILLLTADIFADASDDTMKKIFKLAKKSKDEKDFGLAWKDNALLFVYQKESLYCFLNESIAGNAAYYLQAEHLDKVLQELYEGEVPYLLFEPLPEDAESYTFTETPPEGCQVVNSEDIHLNNAVYFRNGAVLHDVITPEELQQAVASLPDGESFSLPLPESDSSSQTVVTSPQTPAETSDNLSQEEESQTGALPETEEKHSRFPFLWLTLVFTILNIAGILTASWKKYYH